MRPHGHPNPCSHQATYLFQLRLVMEGTVVQVVLGLCTRGSANLHVQEVVHPGHNLDMERAHTLTTPAGCTHVVTFFPPPPAFTGCQSHTQEAQPPPDGRCAPGPPRNLFTSCSNKASPTGTQRGEARDQRSNWVQEQKAQLRGASLGTGKQLASAQGQGGD